MGLFKSKPIPAPKFLILKIVLNDHHVIYYRLEDKYLDLLTQINRRQYSLDNGTLKSLDNRHIDSTVHNFIYGFYNGNWENFAIKLSESTIEKPGSPRNYEIYLYS